MPTNNANQSFFFQLENLKRINKMWSNDDLHITDTLLIPNPPTDSPESEDTQIGGIQTFQFYDGLDFDSYVAGGDGVTRTRSKSKSRMNNNKTGHFPVPSSSDSTDVDASRKGRGEPSNEPPSEAFNSLNEMLSRIDSQIKSQKDR